MKYDATFITAKAMAGMIQMMPGMTRTITLSGELRIAPTQKEINPYANARSIEIGSAGVPRTDIATATPSQIQSGIS
ncbi:MAG: hypothetical protein U0795_24780 [Pirellulales bacterium]